MYQCRDVSARKSVAHASDHDEMEEHEDVGPVDLARHDNNMEESDDDVEEEHVSDEVAEHLQMQSKQ